MTSYRIDGWSDLEWFESPPGQRGTVVKITCPQLGTWAMVPRKRLIPHPDARTTDPDTSHAAAAMQTAEHKRQVYTLILRVLRQHGACNDFELARYVTAEGLPIKQTSVGKRRLELVRQGLVKDSGTTWPSDTGTQSIRWELTNEGRKEAVA